jgi:hypothetical protein
MKEIEREIIQIRPDAELEPPMKSPSLGERLTGNIAERLLTGVIGDLTRYTAEEKTRRQTGQL